MNNNCSGYSGASRSGKGSSEKRTAKLQRKFILGESVNSFWGEGRKIYRYTGHFLVSTMAIFKIFGGQ